MAGASAWCCIRCGESPAIDERGCCGHCHWRIGVEIEQGLEQLYAYLQRHSDPTRRR